MALADACTRGAIPNLRELYLGQNNIGNAGISALAQACASGALTRCALSPPMYPCTAHATPMQCGASCPHHAPRAEDALSRVRYQSTANHTYTCSDVMPCTFDPRVCATCVPQARRAASIEQHDRQRRAQSPLRRMHGRRTGEVHHPPSAVEPNHRRRGASARGRMRGRCAQKVPGARPQRQQDHCCWAGASHSTALCLLSLCASV